MLNLVFFILICYGATQILAEGTIFEWVRVKLKLSFFRCSMCMGFWVGAMVFFLFWWSGVDFWPQIETGWFVGGCISSGASYFLTSLIGDDGFKIKHKT